jgi:hypothetical protein
MNKLERQARRLLRTARQIENGEHPGEKVYLRALDRLVSEGFPNEAIEFHLRQLPSNALRTVLEKLPEAIACVEPERRVGLRQMKRCVERVLKGRICVAE